MCFYVFKYVFVCLYLQIYLSIHIYINHTTVPYLTTLKGLGTIQNQQLKISVSEPCAPFGMGFMM